MAKLYLGKAQISGAQILLRIFVIVREYDYHKIAYTTVTLI